MSFVVMFFTVFVSWCVTELLERKFKLKSSIILTKILKKLHPDDVNKRVQAIQLIHRLTKSVDNHGYYRIEPRAVVYLVKALRDAAYMSFSYSLLTILIVIELRDFIYYCVHMCDRIGF